MFAVFKQKLTDRISIVENGVSRDRRQERVVLRTSPEGDINGGFSILATPRNYERYILRKLGFRHP